MGTLVNGIKEIFATAKTTGSNVMLCGNDGTPDGHMTMASLANALGAITTEFSYCHRHNAGELTAEFCDYVDNEMQTSYQPRLVMVDTNTWGAAFGIKTNEDYCAFVIVSYDGIYSAIKWGGSWIVQRLSSNGN